MKTLPRTIVAAVVLAGMCVFVFVMSAMPGSDSGGLSLKIAKAIVQYVVAGYDALPVADQIVWQDRVHYLVRKGAHFTEYAVLGALAANLLRQALRDPEWAGRARRLLRVDARSSAGPGAGQAAVSAPLLRMIVASWVFCVAYAASDEFHQLFVPGRAGAVGDVAIDSAGALVGILVFIAVSHRARANGR